MKRGILCVLMVFSVLAWASAPAWSDEQTQAPAQGAAAPPAAQPNADPAPAKDATTETQAPPAAPDTAAPAAAAPSAPAGVEIKDAVVCQDVSDRAPVGSSDVFSKDLAKVYCYCRVVGMQGEGTIVHNWYYQGALKSSIKLPVRAANWRTWSYKAISPQQAGEWMVEIITESGAPLESVVFMVQ
jgi:hypothetical protein